VRKPQLLRLLQTKGEQNNDFNPISTNTHTCGVGERSYHVLDNCPNKHIQAEEVILGYMKKNRFHISTPSKLTRSNMPCGLNSFETCVGTARVYPFMIAFVMGTPIVIFLYIIRDELFVPSSQPAKHTIDDGKSTKRLGDRGTMRSWLHSRKEL